MSLRAADIPGADDLMLNIYAAMAQKERELIDERTRAALAAAKRVGGAGRGSWYRPSLGPDAILVTLARGLAAMSHLRRTEPGKGARKAQGSRSVPNYSLSKYGFRAGGVRTGESFDRGATGL